VIAAVFAALLTLLATVADQPADVGGSGLQGVPVADQHVIREAQPPEVSPAPQSVEGVPVHADSLPVTAESPRCDEPGAVPGECIAVQLPGETDGRAYG
jgi:hypothetical protein